LLIGGLFLAGCAQTRSTSHPDAPKELAVYSAWDKGHFSQQFTNVLIATNRFAQAFEEMTSKYLLRVNLLLDAPAYRYSATFGLECQSATGREILDAFVAD